MGIAEKRAVEEAKTKYFDTFQKDVNAAVGTDVAVEVDWSSLAVDGYAHVLEEGVNKIFFESTLKAIKAVGADAMGKEALQGGLKKIVIKNTDKTSSPRNAYSFDGGVLTIDHRPASNVEDISQRADELKELLESKL